jgi:Cu(I)/Ag(I) efflux system membrane fusion protein
MKKLIFFVAAIFLMAANSSCSNSGSKQKEATTEVSIKDTTLSVQGSCGMCKTKIEKAATEIEGVTAATWDSEAKSLTFSYDAAKTSPEVVSKAIAKIGYDTELDKAADEAYNALPGCCKYREENS